MAVYAASGAPTSSDPLLVYLQQFLPYGRQDLHVTTCGRLRLLRCVCIHSALVPNLHRTAWRQGKK